MKILALSDEVVESLYRPEIRERFGDVDVILGCGDLPFFYLEFMVTVIGKPLYYIHGNHDKPFQYLSDGRIINRAEGCEDIETKCVHVRLAGGDLLLAGLGGSIRYNEEGLHQYTQAEMNRRLLSLTPTLLANRVRYGRYLDVLITHAPPRGIHESGDRAHIGFEAFLTLMDRFRPRFLLHGHSHVYRNDAITATRYKETQVLNVYPYRLIDFDQNYV
ncbi:MAG: metallophosphoesterase [Anaerolineales bacterium]|nr:metallophosphoesterase [Anaerolineales bacterium]